MYRAGTLKTTLWKWFLEDGYSIGMTSYGSLVGTNDLHKLSSMENSPLK